MFNELRTSLSLFLLLMLLTGLGYPMLVLGLGQNLFPHQAQGSLIEENGKIIGSSLIGQKFSGEAYFHSRPSAAGNGYEANNSAGSNLAPTSDDLLNIVTDRVVDLKKTNVPPIPVDLATASASGLDPHISLAAAHFQIARVAAARNVPVATLEELVTQYTEPRTFGLLGDNRVNVFELNRALDRMKSPSSVP